MLQIYSATFLHFLLSILVKTGHSIFVRHSVVRLFFREELFKLWKLSWIYSGYCGYCMFTAPAMHRIWPLCCLPVTALQISLRHTALQFYGLFSFTNSVQLLRRIFTKLCVWHVLQNTSMPRIFKLFRGLGLRHLVVVNRKNEVMTQFMYHFALWILLQ